MSYYSPALENYLASRKKNDNTKKIIESLKDNLPELSTIVDYGGKSSVDDILHLQQSDTSPRIYNNFQKILLQSNQTSDTNTRSRKYLSFIDYKAKPSKAKQKTERKKGSKKTLHTSIVVDMPEELKEMKNQILLLPSVGHSRMLSQKQSSAGSRLVESLNKSHSRRYQTENSEQVANRFHENKKNYLSSIRGIMTEFSSPQINCNSEFLELHRSCKKILEEEQALQKQYKHFESLGSPPNKIIKLTKLLKRFSTTIQKNIDTEIAEQISNMDSKRYDIVLKHQEEARKYNLSKFREKKKQEKLEQLKGGIQNNASSEPEGLGFKLNSKGKLIYLNKNKGK